MVISCRTRLYRGGSGWVNSGFVYATIGLFSNFTPATPGITRITGNFRPSISVTGNYRPNVSVTGNYRPTVRITGNWSTD